jgi:hypothetical protein
VIDQKVIQYNSETGWLDFLVQVGLLPFKVMNQVLCITSSPAGFGPTPALPAIRFA